MEAEKLDRMRVSTVHTVHSVHGVHSEPTPVSRTSSSATKCTADRSQSYIESGDLLTALISDPNAGPDAIISAQRVTTGCQIYEMSSRPRGFCLIINNVDFDNNQYPRRSGSDQEALSLRQVFSQLYFEVIIKKNQSQVELLQTLFRISKHGDLRKHDCLVVIVLSHGYSGHLYAADNRCISFEHVLSFFNNQNCPHLIRKPKMFFFNCCRGPQMDFGPQLFDNDDTSLDVPDAAIWPDVPIISDMMICFSTIDGYVSWRNEQCGTWFGSALSTALTSYAYCCDLNQLLTIASDNINNRSTRNGAKQAIEWKYRAWTKSLYFNPGYFAQ